MTETATPDAEAAQADLETKDEEQHSSPPARIRPEWPERATGQRALAKTVAEGIAELRFVRDRPCSLTELLAIARNGAWTTATTGQLRRLATIHVWIVQVPLLTIGAVIAWTARTPGRVHTVIPVLMTIATALNAIPVVDLVIPDWSTWTYWPPLSWLY